MLPSVNHNFFAPQGYALFFRKVFMESLSFMHRGVEINSYVRRRGVITIYHENGWLRLHCAGKKWITGAFRDPRKVWRTILMSFPSTCITVAILISCAGCNGIPLSEPGLDRVSYPVGCINGCSKPCQNEMDKQDIQYTDDHGYQTFSTAHGTM